MKTIKDIAREMRRRALDFKGGNLPAEAVIAAGEDMEMFADRVEAAARNATMLCHQVCSCEILAKMETVNERLRALVKELADKLDGPDQPACINCTLRGCPGVEECRYTKETIALVAKAREEVKE